VKVTGADKGTVMATKVQGDSRLLEEGANHWPMKCGCEKFPTNIGDEG